MHTMNNNQGETDKEIPGYQLQQFQVLINELFQCCQERTQFQSEKFQLPDAELRCLMLFGGDRYLTPKGIAYKMNVVKSRVTKIVEGLVQKNLVQRVADPVVSTIMCEIILCHIFHKWQVGGNFTYGFRPPVDFHL